MGRLIAGGDAAGMITLWESPSGAIVRELTTPATGVRTVEFSPDGTTLVAAGDDELVHVWNLESGELLRSFRPHDGPFYAARFAPSGGILATCGRDQLVKIWNVKTWQQIATLAGHADRVYDIAFSGDGQRIVSVGEDRSVRLWNLERQEVEKQFVASLQSQYSTGWLRFDSAAFSDDGRLVAGGSNHGPVFVWEVETGTELAAFVGHTSNVRSLAFSADCTQLASGSKDTSVRIWDLEQKKLTEVIQGHGRPVNGVRYARDGRLVTCGKDGSVRAWKNRPAIYVQRDVPEIRTFTGAISPSDGLIAFHNGEDSQWLIDRQQNVDVVLAALHGVWRSRTAFSGDRQRFAAFGEQLMSGDGVKQLAGGPADLRDVDADGDGDLDRVAGIGRWRHWIWQERDHTGVLRRPRLLIPSKDPRELSGVQVGYLETGGLCHVSADLRVGESYCVCPPRTDQRLELAKCSRTWPRRPVSGQKTWTATETSTCW